jgi:hypothetical protein
LNKFHLTNNTDIFYTVDGIRTYSKIAAIHAARGDLSKIKFHWMEDTWDKIDWSIEPDLSWNQLMTIRCQQIRDKYNYVAMFYSGGYDSWTILKCFIDNKLLVDELLIYDRRDWFDDPEIPHVIAHAQYVKNTFYPNLKINVVRVNSDATAEFYKGAGEDWIFHPNCSLKYTKTTRYFSTNLMTDFITTMREKDRCNIMAVDKPKLLLRDGKWFSFIPDVQIDHSGSNQENFYYSSELPQLHIKQCHMAVSWFESLPELNEDLVHDIQGRDKNEHGALVKYYAAWNIGMGRLPIPHAHLYSINGAMKFFHTNDEKSRDAIGLLDYVKKHDIDTYKIYTTGLINARMFGTELTDKTILSKQYFIKDRKVQAF